MVSRNRGFSMLELGMVVSIVGVTAAIAIPRVSSSVQRTKVERAASLLAADISRVRENAKAYGLQQTITFSGNSYTISTVTASGTTTRTVDLTKEPVEARLQVSRTTGVNAVNFNAYGIPDQEFVVGVTSNGVWRMVTVTANSGDIDVVTSLPTRFASDVRNASIGPVTNTTAVIAAESGGTSTGTSGQSATTTTAAMSTTSTTGNGNGNTTTTSSTAKQAK